MLYGFETWALTLREEYRQRVLVSRLLRKVFGSKSEEVIKKKKRENCAVRRFMVSSSH